jgi:ABC-type amino acid transport substrate-binding protein
MTPDSMSQASFLIAMTLAIKLVSIVLLVFLIAALCQSPPGSPTSQPAPQYPTPTPILVPPIQPGDGSDLMDRLLERGVIRVGIRVWPEAAFSPPAFRGFSNAETGGALNGFEVDIARLVAEGLGLELELVEAYPPVIASGDWRGEWDIAIASLVPFDQLLAGTSTQNVGYSAPYAYVPMGILIPTTESGIQTPDHLSGRKVGVLEHSAYQRLLASGEQQLTVHGQPLVPPLPTDLQLVELSNLSKAIRQLGQPDDPDAPQVDALFGPSPIFQEAIKSGLPVKLAVEGKNVGIQPLVIAAVPQDGLKVERLLSETNKVVARLQRQGILAEVYIRWYEQDLSQPP